MVARISESARRSSLQIRLQKSMITKFSISGSYVVIEIPPSTLFQISSSSFLLISIRESEKRIQREKQFLEVHHLPVHQSRETSISRVNILSFACPYSLLQN